MPRPTRALLIALSLVAGIGCFANAEPIDEESTSAAATTEPADSGSGATTTDSDGADGVIGPLLPLDNLDDGAMFPEGSGYNAHWYPSGEDNAEGRQYVGQFPAGMQYYAYMRFQLPEALPSGSIVDSVVLELSGHDEYDWNGAYALKVWVQDSPDAAAVGGTFDYPVEGSAVVFLETAVRWPATGGLVWQQPGPNETPNLAPLLQALIDKHGGLATGAYVQFWVGEDVLDGIGEEVGWLDSVAGPETAPKLTIGVHGA